MMRPHFWCKETKERDDGESERVDDEQLPVWLRTSGGRGGTASATLGVSGSCTAWTARFHRAFTAVARAAASFVGGVCIEFHAFTSRYSERPRLKKNAARAT